MTKGYMHYKIKELRHIVISFTGNHVLLFFSDPGVTMDAHVEVTSALGLHHQSVCKRFLPARPAT